jgi:hypothetical protein
MGHTTKATTTTARLATAAMAVLLSFGAGAIVATVYGPRPLTAWDRAGDAAAAAWEEREDMHAAIVSGDWEDAVYFSVRLREAIKVGLHYHGIRPDAIRERSRRFWIGEESL